MYLPKYRYVPRKQPHRAAALILAAALLLSLVIGGTLAYLLDQDTPITNIFTPSHVGGDITEEFDGKVKQHVKVQNTGDIDAYIRVCLVSYRVNAAGERIGGTASVPAFTPGSGWVHHTDGYYYYTKPVQPNAFTAELIDQVTLVEYSDADGGRQVLEILAEAIQSVPARAVGEAWGVAITEGSVSAYQSA